MFSRIHERLGTAGLIVAIVALIAALSGTALAAVGLNGKQKKEVTKIAKKYAGKRGATGPAGAAGPAGAPGEKGAAGAAGARGATGAQGAQGTPGTPGAAGTPGTPGTNGKTILSGTTAPTAGQGVDGDFYIRTSTSEIYGPKTSGVWGSPTSLKGADGAPGAAGSPWVVGTAPANVILKGTWSIQQYDAAGAGEKIAVPVSTGVPIPTGTYFGAARGGGLSNGEEEESAEGVCNGTAANPTINTAGVPVAAWGIVCIYAQEQTNLNPPTPGFELSNTNSGGGAVAMFQSAAAGEAKGHGTWVLFTAG